MGYRIIAQGGSLAYGIKYYQCDRLEDLVLLPKDAPGCKAYIVNTKKEFTLDNSNKWTETTDTNDIEDLRKQINNLQINAYKFKGSVANFEALSEISHPEEGDVYNTLDNGMNYGYTGTSWDALGQLVDLDLLATKQELSNEVTTINTELNKKYVKPDGGIPESHLHNSVQLKLVQSGQSLPTPLMPGELFLKFNNNDNIPELYTGRPGNLNNPFKLNPQLPMVTRNTNGYLASGQYAELLDGLSKLSTIDENAQVNKIESINLNGIAQTIDNNKNVNIIVPTDLGDFTNNAGYIKSNALPTKVSDLTNDSNFITANDIPTIPSKLGDLTDDVGYAKTSDLPTDLGDLTNNANYAKVSQLPSVPTDLGSFTNEAGYAKLTDIPSIPTNVSAFTNDAGYITRSSLPGTANTNTAGISKLYPSIGSNTDGSITQNAVTSELNKIVTSIPIDTFIAVQKNLQNGFCYLDSTKNSTAILTYNNMNAAGFSNDFYLTFNLLSLKNISLIGFYINKVFFENNTDFQSIFIAYGKYQNNTGLMYWIGLAQENENAQPFENINFNCTGYQYLPIDTKEHTLQLVMKNGSPLSLILDDGGTNKTLSAQNINDTNTTKIFLQGYGADACISKTQWIFMDAEAQGFNKTYATSINNSSGTWLNSCFVPIDNTNYTSYAAS